MLLSPERVQYMDVAPAQIVSVSALIPLLEHDDANRARLMGANMQRQAVPGAAPREPLVGTGVERVAAVDSGTVVTAAPRRHRRLRRHQPHRHPRQRQRDGGRRGGRRHLIPHQSTSRSNQNTNIHQRPIVKRGDLVAAGDVRADGASHRPGRARARPEHAGRVHALERYNFEDSILISERVVAEDRYTSIHIEELKRGHRDTKLGPEEITRDIRT